MSAYQLTFYVALLVAALMLSAMFAGIETGIYTLNRIRLALESGRARKAALRLLEEIRFPNRLLATLLIGNACAHDLGSIAIAPKTGSPHNQRTKPRDQWHESDRGKKNSKEAKKSNAAVTPLVGVNTE